MASAHGGRGALPEVPDDLDAALARYFGDEGRAFSEALPARVTALADRWSLELGEPLTGARTAFVAPCRRPDGTSAVLRVAFPEQHPAGEAAALSAWGGEGSVRLLEHDEGERALLVERCLPGTHLSAGEAADSVLAIGARLLRRLWRRGPGNGPYLRLEALAGRRAGEAEERRERLPRAMDATLVDEGIALWRELPQSGGELLLHGDLQPRNILAAAREPWLVIDPKPLLGDPAYEPVPLVLEAGGTAEGPEIARRVRAVSGPLALEPARVAAWGVARSVDWALFLAERGDPAGSGQAAAAARAFAALL
ncbi:MAG TPA: aminoglycoside phosphotransferase family protein [Acidimicrobiales bacterium]|nr:aminoglycoside phosphotransferase family protein [Acidimicrobiales bacterium]